MPFYKKKPVVIEAMQLAPDNAHEVSEFCGFPVLWTRGAEPRIDIKTLEGTMSAPVGWWVIKGVKGEFYPCDPEVFEASYNPLSAAG